MSMQMQTSISIFNQIEKIKKNQTIQQVITEQKSIRQISIPHPMIDKKKLTKRIAKQNKIKEMPLLNLYILVFSILVCVGSLFRIHLLQLLKPIPMIMMIIYIHNKNSARQHLVPNVVEAGLVVSLVGDVLLMSNQIQSFVVGTGFFLVAHVCYIVAFGLGEEIRYIKRGYVWGRRVACGVVMAMCVGNTYMLFDKMPNRVLFPLYGFILALMVCSAMKRYENTTPYSFGFVIAGSLLFALSDNLLGFLKLNEIKTDVGRMMIMLTYYAGQYLIMHGSLHHSNLQHQINQFNKYRKSNYVIM